VTSDFSCLCGGQGLVETELYNCTGRIASQPGVFDFAEKNLGYDAGTKTERKKLAEMLKEHFV